MGNKNMTLLDRSSREFDPCRKRSWRGVVSRNKIKFCSKAQPVLKRYNQYCQTNPVPLEIIHKLRQALLAATATRYVAGTIRR